MFKFKQFTVNQEGAPFKIGTDSMILGSWVKVNGYEKVLDIGTGTGVLALMIAQNLGVGKVLALEPERTAFEVAERNFKNSPFSDRLIVVNEPLQRIKPNEKFDLIITNPPYFIGSTKNQKGSAARARHTDELSFLEIAQFSAENLSLGGRLCIILPVREFSEFEKSALEFGLYPNKILEISSFDGTEIKRICAEFSKEKQDRIVQNLSVRLKESQEYSAEYKALTEEFHFQL